MKIRTTFRLFTKEKGDLKCFTEIKASVQTKSCFSPIPTRELYNKQRSAPALYTVTKLRHSRDGFPSIPWNTTRIPSLTWWKNQFATQEQSLALCSQNKTLDEFCFVEVHMDFFLMLYNHLHAICPIKYIKKLQLLFMNYVYILYHKSHTDVSWNQ